MSIRRRLVSIGALAAFPAVAILALGACATEGDPDEHEAPGVDGTALSTSSNGLLGDYFRDATLTSKVSSRVDSTVNFFWGVNAPATGVPADGFSVRWTGFVTPRFSETYTFSTYSDDGTRLWVDGKEIINDWNHHAVTWTPGTITLKANQAYAIRLEYFDQTGNAQVQLSWHSASEPYAVIPASQLSPAPAGSGGGGATPPPFEVGLMMGENGGPTGVAAYQSWLGPRKVTVVGSYNGDGSWDAIENTPWILADYAWKPWVKADPAHRMVQVGVIPWAGTGSLAACANGAYDSHYTAMGHNYVNAGMGRTAFRFAWEESGYWFKWGTQSVGSDGVSRTDPKLVASFKGCFQHFSRAIHAADPAAIVTWDSEGAAFNSEAYPGDDVVDEVSHDVYDESFHWDNALGGYVYPFPSGCDAACRTDRRERVWKEDIGPTVVAGANFATQHGKRFSLGEFGVAWKLNGHGGLDNPGFIQHIHDVMTGKEAGMLPGFRPGFATYWENRGDKNSAGQYTIDSRIQSGQFPNAAARYRQLFGN